VVTRVCVSVCVSVRGRMPTLLHGPGCNLGEWQEMPPSSALLGGFAIGARVALLWQHYGNAWQSPAEIRHAHRTPHPLCHALRMPAKTPPASANIAACAVPFRPYCGGVVTRTRNVSEYMLVLAHVPSCVYCSLFLQLNRDGHRVAVCSLSAN